MTLIKFIATAALVASTSFVSGGNAASATLQIAPQAAACQEWPYCRDVEIKDDNSEQQLYVAACQEWPYCRDVEVTEQVLPQPLSTATVRNAV